MQELEHLAEETLFRWPAGVTAGSSSLFPLYDELHGHKDKGSFVCLQHRDALLEAAEGEG